MYMAFTTRVAGPDPSLSRERRDQGILDNGAAASVARGVAMRNQQIRERTSGSIQCLLIAFETIGHVLGVVKECFNKLRSQNLRKPQDILSTLRSIRIFRQ